VVDEGGLARDLAGVYRTTLSIRDVEGFVGVRKETRFYSNESYIAFLNIRRYTKKKERKSRERTDKAINLGIPSIYG